MDGRSNECVLPVMRPSTNAAAPVVPSKVFFVRWVLPAGVCELYRSLAPAAGGAVDQVGAWECGREEGISPRARRRRRRGDPLRILQRIHEAAARILVLDFSRCVNEFPELTFFVFSYILPELTVQQMVFEFLYNLRKISSLVAAPYS